MKIKSFLLGGLVCYIFSFFIYFGVSLLNRNASIDFGEVSDSYYKLSDEVDVKINSLESIDLSDSDKVCLDSLKGFKKFSNDTSNIGLVSFKEFSNIFADNNQTQIFSDVLQNCISNKYNDNNVVPSFYSINYFYSSIYKNKYSNYQFIFSDVDNEIYFYRYGFVSTKSNELYLIVDILNLMEVEYE